MDKYEHRRLSLQQLVDGIGHGGISRVAGAIGKEPNYVSRMLYPEGKRGGKRIGEDSVELLNAAYPGWLDEPATKDAGSIGKPSQHQINRAWPFATVTIERFEALGYEQKVIVEDALVQAIERMEQRAASKGNANAVRIDSTPQPKRGNGG